MTKNQQNLDMIDPSYIENGCFVYMRYLSCIKKANYAKTATGSYSGNQANSHHLDKKGVRSHWGVENGLHLALDVIFNEDKHRYQDRVGAANLSLLRKVALGILTKDSLLGSTEVFHLLV